MAVKEAAKLSPKKKRQTKIVDYNHTILLTHFTIWLWKRSSFSSQQNSVQQLSSNEDLHNPNSLLLSSSSNEKYKEDLF